MIILNEYSQAHLYICTHALLGIDYNSMNEPGDSATVAMSFAHDEHQNFKQTMNKLSDRCEYKYIYVYGFDQQYKLMSKHSLPRVLPATPQGMADVRRSTPVASSPLTYDEMHYFSFISICCEGGIGSDALLSVAQRCPKPA